jgi:hypothetical protein
MNAFPIAIPAGCEGYEDGMTLRDYFAGQALPALIADAYSPESYLDFDNVFRHAYKFADAMLEARGE